ncbi:MAG: hypothetical protein AAF601_05055 [Pseudomonadota bacterium]
MSYKKECVTAAGTLAIAVGIGFIMQNTDSADQRYGQASLGVPLPVAAADPEAGPDGPLDVQEIELTSARPSGPEILPAAAPVIEFSDDPSITRAVAPVDALLTAPLGETLQSIDSCDVTANARAMPGAMVSLSFDAPCAPNERVTVHHNGLMFSYASGPDGALDILVPAMVEEAVFIFSLPGGDGAVAQASVTDINRFSRVALQWRGQAGFQLHAREFGANYGDDGHVWSQTTPDLARVEAGQTGFLMRLGNEGMADPLVAEIYSFAAADTARTGVIDMSIEAEVTSLNCGQTIEAQSFEMEATGDVTTHILTLDVPGCEATGDFLVLNNLLPDMKVAAN